MMKTHREMQDAVERRLRWAPGLDAEDAGVAVQHVGVAVPHAHIKSSISHGVVILHGSVGCWQDVLDAEEAVGDVRGVEDVVTSHEV